MQGSHPDRADAAERTGPIHYLSIFLLWALVAATFYQFFTRYILNNSAAWTEEIAQYGLVLIVFVGSIIVSRKNGHIRMVVLQMVLPVRAKNALYIISSFIEVALTIVLLILSIRILPQMHEERMVFAAIPLSVIYAGIALSLGMHVFIVLRRILLQRRASKASQGE